MGKLTYAMMVSLDGYVCDVNGGFDWGQIDDEVHSFANAELAKHGTEIYGRRMYETMVYWETADQIRDQPATELAFAKLWQAMDKIVVSSSLDAVSSRRTQLVPAMSPADVRALKQQSDHDMAVSGPTIAAPLLRAGLVDEVGIYYIPVVVGDGTPMFARDLRLDLKTIERTSFANGVEFLRYRPRT